MIPIAIINLAYLLSAGAFVTGLRGLSSPDTARRGNRMAGFGMGLAILATLLYPFEGADNNYVWIAGGMLLGTGIGWLAAKRVQMTDMPQLVSIFNGLGGACAVVLVFAELHNFYGGVTELTLGGRSVVLLAALIGGVSFTGSMLAYAKLQGLVKDSTVTLPMHNVINLVLLVVTLAAFTYVLIQGEKTSFLLASVAIILSLIYGYSFVAPIGGADMPVVISLLNSFTGLSAAAAGLIYDNQIMLLGGILVGASGTILTVLMCEAMNRSLLNVLVGGFGSSSGSSAAGAAGDQVAKTISLPDAAIQLFYSKSVIIVPGYGLAVAQAQKTCKELDDQLSRNGVEVKYAIHPVAGRMPGHMNVLLAEADVPYPKLLDLEEANDALAKGDVAIIIGANDVVNPAALDDPGSPLYGMPILRVWDSKAVFVMKRSMRPGYSGVENQLFFHERTKMLFGDAKDTLEQLVKETKGL